MRFFHKPQASLWLATALLASIAFIDCTAQTAPEKRHGSFISINGNVSGGHIISTISEGNVVVPSAAQTLGNLNIGWFNYWQHLSGEVQFTASPFVSTLSNQRSAPKTIGMQFWFGYSVFDNEMFRISPAIGFGSYNFRAATGDGTTNAHLSIGIGGEAFIPESRIMLGLRAGYQHTFLLPTGPDSPTGNAGGAVVQVRTAIRIH